MTSAKYSSSCCEVWGRRTENKNRKRVICIIGKLIPNNFFGDITISTSDSCNSGPDVWQCLVVQTPMDNMSTSKQSTAMTHTACKLKLRSVVWSSMHPSPGNYVAIGSKVVYYARAAHAFSAGIKCQHCIEPRLHWLSN